MNPFGDTPKGTNPFGDRPTSTITNKPIQTSDERIQQSREGWRTAAPIIGDVGMTMLAPQLKGPSMAGKAINLLMRMGGAAAGAGGGSVVGQKMAGQDVDMGEAGKEALVGGAGELGLTGAGQALKLAKKPIKYGAEYLARPLKPALEAAQSKVAKKEVKALGDFMDDIAPDIIKKQDVPMKDIDLQLSSAGGDIGIAYKKYEDVLDDYASKNNGVVNMDRATQFLTDLRNKVGAGKNRLAKDNAVFKEFGFNLKQRSELAALLREGKLTPESIKWMLSSQKGGVFAGYMKLTPTQKGMREELKAAFLDDIGGAVGAKDLRKEADLMFKGVKRFEMVRNLFRGGQGVSKEGVSYIYPYKIAKKILMNKKALTNPKTGVPELWPQLEELANHYIDIYKPLQKIKGGDNFATEKAFGLMPKVMQKILSGLAGVGKQTAKAGGKAALHLGGQEIDF